MEYSYQNKKQMPWHLSYKRLLYCVFNIKFNSRELNLTTLFHYSLLLFTFQKILNAESVNSEK